MGKKHVGEYLRKMYINPYHIRVDDLAKSLGVSNSLLRKVLTGERILKIELAKRMEKVLGIAARDLLIMQLEYQLSNLSEDDYVQFKRFRN